MLLARLCGSVALAVVTFASPMLLAQDADGVEYRLTSDTLVYVGCFPPCRCAMRLFPETRGTFTLTPVEPGVVDDGFDRFEVSDVAWTAGSELGAAIRLTGSGTYRVRDGDSPLHQLVLDLSVDGAEPERWDSGLVEGGGEFPTIRIDISINGRVCFDHAADLTAVPSEEPFARGDCNADGDANIADAVFTLMALFGGGGLLPCAKACDVDDSGDLLLTDAVVLLQHLFGGEAPPPPPGPDCGVDPTADALGCEHFDGCA